MHKSSTSHRTRHRSGRKHRGLSQPHIPIEGIKTTQSSSISTTSHQHNTLNHHPPSKPIYNHTSHPLRHPNVQYDSNQRRNMAFWSRSKPAKSTNDDNMDEKNNDKNNNKNHNKNNNKNNNDDQKNDGLEKKRSPNLTEMTSKLSVPLNQVTSKLTAEVSSLLTPQIDKITKSASTAASTITKSASTAASTITSSASTAATSITPQLTKLTQSATSAASSITQHKSLPELVKTTTNVIPDLVKGTTDLVKTTSAVLPELVKTTKTGLTSSVSHLKTDLTSSVSHLKTDLTSSVTSVAAGVTSGVTSVAAGVTSGVTSVAAGVTSGVTSLKTGVTTSVSSIKTGVTSSVSSITTGITTGVGHAVAPLAKLQLSSLQLSQLHFLKFNGNILKNLFAGILPSILSKTTTILPIASIQAAIYTALMLFHRHDKLLSSIDSPSIISQDLSSNLQLFTAVGTVVQRQSLVNYYNLFRSEPWVPKSTVIFLQRYLYLAISSYKGEPYDAIQLASRSGLKVQLLHNSRNPTNFNVDTPRFEVDRGDKKKKEKTTTNDEKEKKTTNTNNSTSTTTSPHNNTNTDSVPPPNSHISTDEVVTLSGKVDINMNNHENNTNNHPNNNHNATHSQFIKASTESGGENDHKKHSKNDENSSFVKDHKEKSLQSDENNKKDEKEKEKFHPSIPFLPEIPFYIFEDKTNGNIVVTIRGTDNLDDLVTDLISWPRQFRDSYVHVGMFSVAQKILPRVLTALREILIVKYIELGIIEAPADEDDGEDDGSGDGKFENDQNGENSHFSPKSLENLSLDNNDPDSPKPRYSHKQLSKMKLSFKDKPIPRIVFTGHSLGGGVAALMTLMCREMNDESILPLNDVKMNDENRNGDELSSQSSESTQSSPQSSSTQSKTPKHSHICPLGNDIDFIHKHYPTNDTTNNNLELVKLLRPESIVYASPALVSPALSEEMKEYTISVLHGDDPVPHLSEYSINNFLGELIKEALTRDPPQEEGKEKEKSNDKNIKKDKNVKVDDKNDPKSTQSQTSLNMQYTPQNLIPGAKFNPYISTSRQQREIDEKRYENDQLKQQKQRDLIDSTHFSVAPDGFIDNYYEKSHEIPNEIAIKVDGKGNKVITRMSKPIPKHLVPPPSTLSKVTSYIPTVVDASLRFHRMFNPAMFVKAEIQRHAKSYLKDKAVDYAKGFAKDVISSQIKNVYDEATATPHSHRSRLQQRAKERVGKLRRRFGKNGEEIWEEDHHLAHHFDEQQDDQNDHKIQNPSKLSKKLPKSLKSPNNHLHPIVHQDDAINLTFNDLDDSYYNDVEPFCFANKAVLMDVMYQPDSTQPFQSIPNWNYAIHPYPHQANLHYYHGVDDDYDGKGLIEDDEMPYFNDDNNDGGPLIKYNHHKSNHNQSNDHPQSNYDDNNLNNHFGDNNSHLLSSPEQPRSKPPQSYSKYTTQQLNAALSSTTTSLDQLAGEFSDFFNRYKSTIQNHIPPSLYNALATLPIAPSAPSRKINPSHINHPGRQFEREHKQGNSNSNSNSGNIKRSDRTTANSSTKKPTFTSTTTQSPHYDDDQSSNLAHVLPSQSQFDEEEDIHRTPLDAIIPVPLTQDALSHSLSWLTQPQFRNRTLHEDQLYVEKFGLGRPRGMWKFDEFNNIMGRMDVPGNVFYIKRINKEVYLAAHQPIMVEEGAEDETLGFDFGTPLGNDGDASKRNENVQKNDEKSEKYQKSGKKTILTTVASQVLRKYNQLIFEDTNEIARQHRVNDTSLMNDATTWYINPVTGLLNVGDQTINQYHLKNDEGIFKGISLTHSKDPEAQLGCDSDPNRAILPTETISNVPHLLAERELLQQKIEEEKEKMLKSDQDGKQFDENNEHVDGNWKKPISFEGGFIHPLPIFPTRLPHHHTNELLQFDGRNNLVINNNQGKNIDKNNNDNMNLNNITKQSKSFKYVPQGNQLITALMGSTDSPAFPVITPLSATLAHPEGTIPPTPPQKSTTSTSVSTTTEATGGIRGDNQLVMAKTSNIFRNNDKNDNDIDQTKRHPTRLPSLNPILASLHENSASLRRRNDMMVSILNTIGETVTTGDIAGITMNNLKSLNNLQKQFESLKLIKSQEYVRVMVRRPAHEFSGLVLSEHMIFDHPSRAYISAFEECLGNDTITISAYSNPANLNGLFGMIPPSTSSAPKSTDDKGSSSAQGKKGAEQQSHQSQQDRTIPSTNTTTATPTSDNTMDSTQQSSNKLMIDPNDVKKIVIGAKVNPTQIFFHQQNSIRSLLPSLAFPPSQTTDLSTQATHSSDFSTIDRDRKQSTDGAAVIAANSCV